MRTGSVKKNIMKALSLTVLGAMTAVLCFSAACSNASTEPEDPIDVVEPTTELETVDDGKYTGSATTSGYTSENGKFFEDFNSMEDAWAYGKQLNIRLAEEGDVLLKNDNDCLPLSRDERNVTLFGVKSVDIQYGGGGSGSGVTGYYEDLISLQQSMEDAGFRVNQKVLDLYENNIASMSYTVSTAGGDQTLTNELPISYYNSTITKTYSSYNDAAIIMFSRTGAEGYDLLMHDVPGHSDTTDHILMLSDAEQDLVRHAKANFNKVIVLINSSNIMEVGELNDPKTKDNLGVDAILWIGHTGNDGAEAIGEILSGEVNPSGHTVDLWSRNFKNDPSWTNFGDGAQVGQDNYVYNGNDDTGFRSVEYREDIYNGYRYYETVAADKNAVESGSGDEWYDSNVVYPFGYGLSYTSFDWEIDGDIARAGKIAGSDSYITMKVNVTNTGDVAGKDVVQVYATTPYTAGGIEKASTVLMGYEKTKLLKPGETQQITISFTAQDMASFDWDDKNDNGFTGYELEAGDYIISVCRDSHTVVDSVTRTITEDITCPYDQDTGKEITAVFSQTEGSLADYNTTNDALVDNLMSRADSLSQPAASTKSDRTVNQAWVDELEGRDTYDVSQDSSSDPWYVSSVPSTWTQATEHEADYSDVTTKIIGMGGVDYTTPTISNGVVTEGTDSGSQAWTAFMNQLTWSELCQIATQGSYGRPSVASIDLPFQEDGDGPAQINWYGSIQAASYYPGEEGYANSYAGTLWVTAVVIASTWNVDLAEDMGRQVGNESILCNCPGWYGPSLDTHRNALGGRNFEYYSEDPVVSGTMAAAEVSGATSKGVVCYAKHMFLNEQETDRDTKRGICTYATEQAIREIYLKPFEYVIKSGHSLGTMAASNRIGTYVAFGDYALQTAILRGEWDFKGMNLTDSCAGNSALNYASLNQMVRNGIDCPLGVGSKIEGNNSYSTDNKYYLTEGEWDSESNMVMIDGTPSPTQYYCVRMAAMHVLYASANSNGIDNGISTADQALTLAGGVETSVDIIEPSAINATALVNVQIVSGDIPDGMTLSSTGVLSGTPTKAGTYAVTISFDADGWVTGKSLTVYITVEDAIAYSGDLEISAGEVSGTFSCDLYAIGDPVSMSLMGYVASGTIDTIEYEVKEAYEYVGEGNGDYEYYETSMFGYVIASGYRYVGEGLGDYVNTNIIPDGLTLNTDGTLSGSITTAGTYTFDVTITASGPVTLYGMSLGNATLTFTQTFIFVVS